MSFKFVNNSQQSQVRRTFACDQCSLEWTTWRTRGDESIPECPQCALAARAAIGAPPSLTTKSQAVDIAQGAMEAMGYTNMQDNQRVGDIAFKQPSEPNAGERHVMTQAQAEMMREYEGATKLSESPQVPGGFSPAQMARDFFKGADGNPMNPLTAGAAVGAHVARGEGRDPMAMLHKTRPPINLDVVASDGAARGAMVVK